MSLQIPSYPSNISDVPLTDVYAWIASQSIDFSSGNARLLVNVNLNTASAFAGAAPIDQIGIDLGSQYDTGDVDEGGQPVMVTFPSLQQVIADNQAAFDSIRTYLYEKVAQLKQFKNAVPVA